MENIVLELLAPAKDKNCAFAAIDYGADAIYTGAPLFGARKNAANSISDIKEMVDYAHKFYAKVYVTINTILEDGELEDVQKLLYSLYDIGVDAIIVQDFGIFELNIPNFRVFASTQCDIRDLNKVKFFEKIGLNRVILARELSLERIKEVSNNTNIEIETFVHGALCVSYSGQCYLSFKNGARSANRGECAQACRKKYSLIDETGNFIAKDKHLLSLKDFCLIENLDDLIKAGVTSFKIEGRLKDENYVKNVTAAYNKALSGYKRVSSGSVTYDFEADVNKSFNRGFCKYFLLNDKKRNIFNFNTPKSTGEFIGEVTNVDKKFFDIKTSVKINAQDGLYFSSNDGALVNSCEKIRQGVRIYPNKMPKIQKGEKVFRNFNSVFEKTLLNSKTKRQIGVKISVYDEKIEAIDEDNNEVQLDFESHECANDSDKMKKTFEEQLRKTGAGDFYVEEIKFVSFNMPFLKISSINELRRSLFERLMNERLKNYKRGERNDIHPSPYPVKNNDYRLNIHNQKALDFYKKCGVSPLQMSFEKCPRENAELMRTKHCLRRAFNLCIKTNRRAADKKLFLVDEKGKKLKLEFDCKNCEMIIRG